MAERNRGRTVRTGGIVTREKYGVNEKEPQDIGVVLQSCGKAKRERQAGLGGRGRRNWRGEVVGGYAAPGGMTSKGQLARSTRREVRVASKDCEL
jgi:hypothetical protein